VVEAIGDQVSRVAVGDHVVLSFDSCGACENCLAGQPAYCAMFMAKNLLGRQLDGEATATDEHGEAIAGRWFGQSSFAQHCISTERNTVVVDPSLPLELLGPLGCGIQTGAGTILCALDVQPGTSVLVVGAGAVGLAGVMAARVAGATTIIAADLHQHRLDLALELGATHVVRGDADDFVAQVTALSGGGVHYAMDTTGVPAVISNVLMATRMAGTVGLVGVQLGPLSLESLAVVGKTIIGVLEGSADPQAFVPRMIALWQEGRFPFDRLIERFPLSEINAAEQSSLAGGVIKPVLIP
jgi:aryl-alcohol dehydrogenase